MASASQTNLLVFWREEDLDVPRVSDFLGLDQAVLAEQQGEPLQHIADLYNQVAAHFEGDVHKSGLWFRTPNPMLGDLSPRDMIRFGRYRRLRQFVLNAQEEAQGLPTG